MGNKSIRDMGSDPAEGTSHPVGETAGTIAGAMAGGVAGSVAGPIGTAAGAAIGGIAGFLEGRTIAEGVNPQRELHYWSENFRNRPYYNKNYSWRDYEPAYTHGVYTYNPDKDYDESDSDLVEDWDSIRGESKLSANEAREASRDAWSRLKK